MTTLYILEDSPIPAGFAMDSEESIHLYLPNGDLFDVWTRGQFFGSDLDFYEIDGDEAHRSWRGLRRGTETPAGVTCQ